ncbi:MAG: SPOR domain-containing protein, partial [Sphingomonadales bacterium]|nr:SPOR domain-containing protein [Sphingomonadales bacterium]
MRFRAVVTSAIVLGTLGAGSAWAEIDVNGPAEVPPASYTGRQYVDSAGCVFVRAGYGTAVNWVPRIDRGRKQLCGYKPTLAEGAPVLQIAKSAPKAAAPTPTPAPAVAPKRTAPVAAPAPARSVSAPQPGRGSES